MSENTRYEHINLPSGGSIPGLPGSHAPGAYVIDWQERTITPEIFPVEEVTLMSTEVPVATEEPSELPPELNKPDVTQEITHLEEELHQLASDEHVAQ